MTLVNFLLGLALIVSASFNVWAVVLLIATHKRLQQIQALAEEALTLYTAEVQERVARGLQ